MLSTSYEFLNCSQKYLASWIQDFVLAQFYWEVAFNMGSREGFEETSFI